MLALRELQTRFADALFDGAVEPMASQIVPNGIDAAARLDIYRNNLREGFIKALALGFPVIERLVGEDYFRHLALDFLRSHPSRAGNLHHIGAPFAGFLLERFTQTEYAYFADIAALEWAHQEALVAVDVEPIAADALRAADPEAYEALRFTLHPACGLVQSAYPIIRIWRANQPEASGEDTIDLASGGDNVLVLRTPECIEFHRLPAGDFAVLAALSRGQTLGAALETAQAADVLFDLGAALRRFTTLQIFTGLQLHALAT
ncbi:MAG: DNA-binding domain-containing protein [Gammaproteobacteria bacterium]